MPNVIASAFIDLSLLLHFLTPATPAAGADIASGIKSYCERKKISDIKSLIGTLSVSEEISIRSYQVRSISHDFKNRAS
jgi:hypothetical protein